ncbi:hypothetical protein [Roseixanthobacter liquoris]|uniref:hypothetical protein n=1 Tax=Roseixanthobacter liquoris TaxID=3119921 RepID=UPI003727CC9D
MTQRIIFLNLADMEPTGLVQKSAQNLAQKFVPRTCMQRFTQLIFGDVVVDVVNLFELLEHRRAAANPSLSLDARQEHRIAYDTQMAQIREACRTARKILLGAHGSHNDTETLRKGLGWELGTGHAGTYDELARMTADFLHPDQSYKLALIICYAARAEDYRKDHDGALSEADIKSSLAYKFYKLLCEHTQANVVMTARTGAVQFLEDGSSYVETEAGVRAVIELEDLARELDAPVVRQKYQDMMEHYGQQGKIRDFYALEEHMSLPHTHATTEHEKVLKDRWRIDNASRRKEDILPSRKYGKFIYRRERDGNVSVFRKYADLEQLYRGPF